MVTLGWLIAEPLMLCFDKLERFLAKRYRIELTDSDIAVIIGVAKESIRKYRRDGLQLFIADGIAIGLGVHPSNIWPEWWNIE